MPTWARQLLGASARVVHRKAAPGSARLGAARYARSATRTSCLVAAYAMIGPAASSCATDSATSSSLTSNLRSASCEEGFRVLLLNLRRRRSRRQANYNPSAFEDEEKKRILAAIDEKIEGKQIVTPAPVEETGGGQVIDLMEALRASLKGGAKPKAVSAQKRKVAEPVAELPLAPRTRKPATRAAKIPAEPPQKVRARK